MPELPDVVVYVEALRRRILGSALKRVNIRTPFLLRSVAPPVDAVHGKTVRDVRRVGKRIAIGFDDDLWLAVHLMIAGRFHWRPAAVGKAVKTGSKNVLAVFEFDAGSLVLTEAGSERRAALHVVAGGEGLNELHAGGLEVLDARADDDAFARALTSANHTLK